MPSQIENIPYCLFWIPPRRFFQGLIVLILGLGFLFPRDGWALRPMSSAIALVAGEGTAGFRDGDFTSAFFNLPLGIAADPDGTRIFVADSGNDRIRVIRLDKDNSVITLNPKSPAGKQNGPLATAEFNQLRGIVYLPGDRLVVNDFGNALLRLVDLKDGKVTSLAGNAPSTLVEGPAAQISMAGIWNMVYLPAADSLFFSQPDLGTLKRLDMKTGQVTLIVNGREGLPHPAALWGSKNTLYIADRDLLQIYALDWKTGTQLDSKPVANAVTNVLALSGRGENLYALQTGNQAPLLRLLPRTEAVTFTSVWGDVIPEPGKYLPSFIHQGHSDPIGFIPDPRDESGFFIANPNMNIVTSYRDLFRFEPTGEVRNSNDVSDFDYPARKPPHTYRILLVGDSLSNWIYSLPFKQSNGSYPHQISISKRLEQTLNAFAALEDEPMKFEVLSQMRIGAAPLFLWPTYEVPEAVRKNDIDLVLILEVPGYPPLVYFERPLAPNGIPVHEIDAEYQLKSPLERIPDGEPRRFYELCKTRNLVRIDGQNIIFENFKTADREVRSSLTRLYGKPLDVLGRNLASMRTSAGKPVRLLLCFTPVGSLQGSSDFGKIWEDVAEKFHIPFLNINKEMTALRLSFYPISQMEGNDHFTPEGHLFFGALLAHNLIKNGLIPWK